MGHHVQIIAPRFAKPFVKSQKNDRNDAEAIAEAASRPTMRYVAMNSVEQQDIQSMHREATLFGRQAAPVRNHEAWQWIFANASGARCEVSGPAGGKTRRCTLAMDI
jgi:hypothetical protein